MALEWEGYVDLGSGNEYVYLGTSCCFRHANGIAITGDAFKTVFKKYWKEVNPHRTGSL
ncbi:MAG: hypothetical protein JW754_02560 [Candidatus Aenigmarchaeota archaeon]|nr:hypothetical protein [Candidatus Aenigmarchaeota archaeon]